MSHQKLIIENTISMTSYLTKSDFYISNYAPFVHTFQYKNKIVIKN